MSLCQLTQFLSSDGIRKTLSVPINAPRRSIVSPSSILQPICAGTEITFDGTSTEITHNNIGGRNGPTEKFALITNVGYYNGISLNLKLESALPNGDDSNCSSGTAVGDNAKCSLEITSNGAVTFRVKPKKVHPIRFMLVDGGGNQITVSHFSFSIFDVGASGSGMCV